MRSSVRGVVVDVAEQSDPGRDPAKQVNEDSSLFAASIHGHLAVVCDGMGGHAGGQEASRAAVRAIATEVESAPAGANPGALLRSGVEAAGRAVFTVGGDQPTELRPGSTCVALLIHEAGAEVAHVGDSRAYLVRGAHVQRLTRDHSMVQQMVDAGVLTPEDAAVHPEANKITRALGMQPEVEVELRPAPLALRPSDVLLLATDGLTDLVADREIQALVSGRIASGPDAVCQALVDLANERGGHDNITVQVVHIVETPPRDDDPTIVDEPPGTMRFGAGPSPTVVDDGREHPAPTLLDEPTRAERTTEPGDLPRPAPTVPPAGAPREHTAPGRWLVVGSASVAAIIVIAVVGWWLSGAFPARHEEPEVPPPPAEPTRSARPETVLEPEPTPEATERPHHHRDGGFRHDAGRDASPEAAGATPRGDP